MLRPMRRRRPYLPGAFFHLTARTQGHLPWFEPAIVKDAVVTSLARAQQETDTELVAYTIMDNHIHLLIKQQNAPLARLMQSFLRRCSLLIARRHNIQGHVFERPFRDKVCSDAHHLRTWIRYVHRNPVKANLCRAAADYKWSSHRTWLGIPPSTQALVPNVTVLRELFRSSSDQTDLEALSAYSAYVDASEYPPLPILGQPAFSFGDHYWVNQSSAVAPSNNQNAPAWIRMDLRDVIKQAIKRSYPELNVDFIRVARGARIAGIRRELIEHAGRAGHRGCDIARYLRVSESHVSDVLRKAYLKDKAKE